MKRSMIAVMSVAAVLFVTAATASAAVTFPFVWKGVTWGQWNGDGSDFTVDGSGNLDIVTHSLTGYHDVNDGGYQTTIHVYPYAGSGTGQSHATWDRGNFTQEWFQFSYIDTLGPTGASPSIDLEMNHRWGDPDISHGTGSTGLAVNSNAAGTSDVSYFAWAGSRLGTPQYADLYARTSGTHTIKVLLDATADDALDFYYDGNLVGTQASSGFDMLESIAIGAYGQPNSTITLTDVQFGSQNVPEPSTLVMLCGLAAAAMPLARWRRKRRGSGGAP